MTHRGTFSIAATPYARSSSPEDDRSAIRAILPPSARADSPWPLPGVSSLSPCQGQPETWRAGAQEVTPHERSSQGVGISENRAACHMHHLPWAMWRISKGAWPQPCAGDPPPDRAGPRSPDAPNRPLPGRCGPQGGERWGTTRCQSGRSPCKKIGRFLTVNSWLPYSGRGVSMAAVYDRLSHNTRKRLIRAGESHIF